MNSLREESGPEAVEPDAGDYFIVSGDCGTWLLGQGEPQIILNGSDYDLARALLGRRSRAQVQAMDWTGDPAPILDHFVVFAYSAEDQPA